MRGGPKSTENIGQCEDAIDSGRVVSCVLCNEVWSYADVGSLGEGCLDASCGGRLLLVGSEVNLCAAAAVP